MTETPEPTDAAGDAIDGAEDAAEEAPGPAAGVDHADGAADAEHERLARPPAELPTWSDLPGGEAAAVESVLMVVDEPVPVARVATILEIPEPRVRELLDELAAEYRGEREGRPRGFELREVGGGWRLYSAPSFAPAVERFVLDGQTARLTQASLETLAVVAYRQPVSRGRISAIRGVNVDGVIRTLLSRGLVEEAGQDPETGATLYRTTPYFLERMGLSSLEELPPLAPYLPDLDGLDDVDGVEP